MCLLLTHDDSDTPFTNRIKWLLEQYKFTSVTTDAEFWEVFAAYISDTANYDDFSTRGWMMTKFPDQPDLPPIPPAYGFPSYMHSFD
jgi:hypothetical protein